ncbi:MAG: non-ribosomal peptide synthetase, partial [Candidatus Binatia bacterium]
AIYTSGSTGTAKGVVVQHGGICNRLLWAQKFYELSETDRCLQKASFSYDASIWEIFEPLLAGAQLVMARPGGRQDPAYLVELIAKQKITVAEFVPSMLRLLLEEKGIESCGTLKRVFSGGEVLPLEVQKSFFEKLPADLYNTYGPTEASVDVTHWKCKPNSDEQNIPIGGAIGNTAIYVLDPHLNPLPIGIPGELHIGGIGLARGYLNQPELTAEKFIPNPFGCEPGSRLYKTGDLARYRPDGNIEFLGRLDHQVKVRGLRIELGEIEAALRCHPAVREAVVLAREDAAGDKLLVAYVVPQQRVALAFGELRTFLKDMLPAYMIPSSFVSMDALPLTVNGKVDRNALPAPDHRRPDLREAVAAPRDALELQINKIWEKILGVKPIGLRDNFFDLGGHSLLAIRLVSQVEK